MSQVIEYLSQPIVALAVTQFVGLIMILARLDRDEEIIARAGTYFDYNPHMLKSIISNNYDEKVGLFTVVFPTFLQAAQSLPFWSSYLCLFIGLVLRFSPLRVAINHRRFRRIEERYNAKSK